MVSLLLILRLLHILAGLIWAGIAFYNAFLVLPAATDIGTDAGKFMRQLPVTNQFLKNVLTTVSTITISTGIGLIAISLGGFSSSWFLTLHGSIVAVCCAIIIYAITFLMNRPKVNKSLMNRLQGKMDFQQMNKAFE